VDSNIAALTYTALTLVPSNSYYFKVAARNTQGYGSQSPASEAILAARIPDTPNSPSTLLQGTFMKISWTSPYNGGSNITAY
jgi:hypothetical protein